MSIVPKRCGYGFICSLMTGAPAPEQCPNLHTCYIQESYTEEEAAEIVLRQRGCHTGSLDLVKKIELLQQILVNVVERIDEIDRSEYIPPDSCEVHSYNVKRPKGVFNYFKLAARHPIFRGVYQETTKVIHLGHENSELHLKAAKAVQRRNTLNQIRKKVRDYTIEVETLLAKLNE